MDETLRDKLATLRGISQLRQLQPLDSPQGPRIQTGGKSFLNFSSNDYLGLSNHPALKESAIQAVRKYGAGSGASRLICGSLAPFHELEERLAAFKTTEAALTFSTGYAAALGTITALCDKESVIILDKRVHASIVDAARLSGAILRIFDHNDVEDLEDKLEWATNAAPAKGGGRPAGILVVTESIFSMDGDTPPLRKIVDLKDKHGAWLMVDEAHATGIIGKNGSGLADELGLSTRIEIQMGTLGKAIGASGGYICGSRALIDYLINRARSFIFSTAPVPAAAAAAIAGIQIVQSSDGRMLRERLQERIGELNFRLGHPQTALASAIIPILLGDESKALAASARLRELGLFIPAIRYPTVARGAARLRVTITTDHTREEVTQAADAIITLKCAP